MPSLTIKSNDLSVGDVLLLPFNKTATITAVKPIGPRTKYVQFRTEHGWTRVEVDREVQVEAQAL